MLALTIFTLAWCWRLGFAAVPLGDFFPRDASTGAVRLTGCVNCNSQSITLPTAFKFFGADKSTCFVNNNGAILFQNSLAAFSEFCGTETANAPMVAPFWADADTSAKGTVSHYVTTDSKLLAKAKADVVAAFSGSLGINLVWALVATWESVPAAGGSTSLTNTFQAVLTTDGTYSFVIFYYNNIGWTKAASMQKFARAALDSLGGNAAQKFSIAGSCSSGISGVATNTNMEAAGKFVFRVDAATVEEPKNCSGSFTTQLSTQISPKSISLYGSEILTLSFACIDSNLPVKCAFEDPVQGSILGKAEIIGRNAIACLTPVLSRISRMNAIFNFTNVKGTLESVIKPVLVELSPAKVLRIASELAADGKIMCKIMWDKAWFTTEQVIIKLHSVKTMASSVMIATVSNTGEATVEASLLFTNQAVVTGTISIQASGDASVGLVTKVFADAEDLYNKLWPGGFENECARWVMDTTIATAPLACPPNVQQASIDPRFTIDLKAKLMYHPGAEICFRSLVPTLSTSQECCYGTEGITLCGPSIGGTVKLRSPQNFYWLNLENDVIPFYKCCRNNKVSADKRDEYCRFYYERRPSDCGRNYRPPIPGGIFGDPHIKTLDGLEFTFNGLGEYHLLQGPDCQAQVRFGTTASIQTATVTKAVSFKCTSIPRIGLHIQPNADSSGIQIYTPDGIELSVSESMGLAPGLTIYKTISSSVVIAGTDVDLEVGIAAGALWVNAYVSQSLLGKGIIKGLLGNFDGVSTNDLQSKAGTVLDIAGNLSRIHYEFGETWRVTKGASFMVYVGGLTYEVVNNVSFKPTLSFTFNKNSFSAAVRAACGDNQACYFDFQASGSVDFAGNTKTLQDTFIQSANALKQVFNGCSAINSPEHGFVVYASLGVGSTATFHCNLGYVITGVPVVTCLANGQWSAGSATCVRFIDAGIDYQDGNVSANVTLGKSHFLQRLFSLWTNRIFAG